MIEIQKTSYFKAQDLQEEFKRAEDPQLRFITLRRADELRNSK